MKLSQEQIAKLKDYARKEDWEGYHRYYDRLLLQCVQELDRELAEEIEGLTDELNAAFWYA